MEHIRAMMIAMYHRFRMQSAGKAQISRYSKKKTLNDKNFIFFEPGTKTKFNKCDKNLNYKV